MDSGRGKHSSKSHKPTSSFNNYHYENNHFNTQSNYPIFKSKFQNQSLKWRKDHCQRGTHRTATPYRRYDNSCKKSNKNTEDEEEEERKKKLNDTAKKLLSKIKSWNAEKNYSEDDSQKNITEVVTDSSCKHNEDKSNADGKPKRIAHSKKAKLVKSRTPKSFHQPAKTVTKYDVNKATVKDFQNRIQHKLIEELMQMPKENLQNVLNDPKINPIMEKKMSRLVKENRPLIAQKLRAIAESKMKTLDCPSNSQLLEDIDKLIDPVIETDLSVLPYELIIQMENIFQVQFDYSRSNTVSQVENCQTDDNLELEINNLEQDVKPQASEDLSIYDCSTDEDDEIDVPKDAIFDLDCKQVNELNKQTDECKSPEGTDSPNLVSVLRNDDTKLKFITSTSCQTDYDNQNASTQTDTEILYGVSLPKEAVTDESISLLDELTSIQTLTNKLNKRRLMIFLQLSRMIPSGGFINNDTIKNSFIETVSNGDFNLIEALKQFLLVKQENFLNIESKE